MSKHLNRRQFLYGVGGATLAIPFLPSLASKAFAADPTSTIPQCYVALATSHGNVPGGKMFPDQALLTQQLDYAGRTVRYGNLPWSSDANGKVVLSQIIKADASVLSASLLAKFNVLRGIDIPYVISHHGGGHLGNFGDTAGQKIISYDTTKLHCPTIDQVIAWSNGFYTAADLSARMTQRSVGIGSDTGSGTAMSRNYASPSQKTGPLNPLTILNSNEALYEHFFDPGGSAHGLNTYLVDRIKDSYNRLLQDPRLSKGDKMRLDQHIERMFEIDRKLAVAKVLANDPKFPPKPSGNQTTYSCCVSHHQFLQDLPMQVTFSDLMTDMLVAAFSTGACRVANWHNTMPFRHVFPAPVPTDWHGEVAHEGLGAAAAQDWTVDFVQGTFEHIMVKLAAKMENVPMADGSSLLDNSLIQYTQEAGQKTHHAGCVTFPIVMAGGAGGFFKTGKFVDYSDQTITYDNHDELKADVPEYEVEHPGLYYNQWLTNALLSMGVTPDQYPQFTDLASQQPTKGYGLHYVDPDIAADYAQAKLVMDEKLPVVTG